MTFVWLIVWLIKGTPDLHQWNSWLVALLVCIVLDCGGGSAKAAS